MEGATSLCFHLFGSKVTRSHFQGVGELHGLHFSSGCGLFFCSGADINSDSSRCGQHLRGVHFLGLLDGLPLSLFS